MRGLRALRIVAIALRSFRRARLQAALTIVAAAVGTGGVVVCSGYAAAGRQKIFDQFRRMGTNAIVVTPQLSRAVGGRARTGAAVTTLREPDYRAILAAVPSIAASSPTVATTLRIRAGDLTKSTTIVGCRADYFAIRNWSAQRGALFDDAGDTGAERVALLGSTAARELFGEADPVGARISIDRIPFTVRGVLRERGQGLDAAYEDAQVYVPLHTAMRRLANVDYFSSIVFEASSWQAMAEIAEAITEILTQRHRAFSQSKPDFQVQSQQSLVDTQLAAYSRLSFFLRWIGVSTLVVGGLGIFGVLWIGVGNRTREIGTCRAIGATIPDVLTQFFAEGVTGPLMGCGAGIALAGPILREMDRQAQQPFLYSSTLAAEASLISVCICVIAAIASCCRAMSVQSGVALRSE
jgi:putative ABC transport system permease protein